MYARSFVLLAKGFNPNSAVSYIQTARFVHTPCVTLTSDEKRKPTTIPELHEPVGHFRSKNPDGNDDTSSVIKPYWANPIPHPIYSTDELHGVVKTHHESEKVKDRLALFAVKAMRKGFDIVSRYKGPGGEMTKNDWLNRCLFLETVAGVPGMVGGMSRHLKSLRYMRRDYGWIHTLLEEAENERMHLLIFMTLKDPNMLFRLGVIAAQGVFFNMFFLTYLLAPKACHRFVGYLEEEAVKTYTNMLQDIEENPKLVDWNQQEAPLIARKYYELPDEATIKDVILCIRADEANHRDVNHTFADIDYELDKNPFLPKEKQP